MYDFEPYGALKKFVDEEIPHHVNRRAKVPTGSERQRYVNLRLQLKREGIRSPGPVARYLFHVFVENSGYASAAIAVRMKACVANGWQDLRKKLYDAGFITTGLAASGNGNGNRWNATSKLTKYIPSKFAPIVITETDEKALEAKDKKISDLEERIKILEEKVKDQDDRDKTKEVQIDKQQSEIERQKKVIDYVFSQDGGRKMISDYEFYERNPWALNMAYPKQPNHDSFIKKAAKLNPHFISEGIKKKGRKLFFCF